MTGVGEIKSFNLSTDTESDLSPIWILLTASENLVQTSVKGSQQRFRGVITNKN